MFGLVLGTLNKAKIEDKERNASEAVGLFYVSLVVREKLTDCYLINRQKNDS